MKGLKGIIRVTGAPWSHDEILVLAKAWRDDGGDIKRGGLETATPALSHRSASALQQKASAYGIAASRFITAKAGDPWSRDEDLVLTAAWDRRYDASENVSLAQILLPHRSGREIDQRSVALEIDKPYNLRSTYKPPAPYGRAPDVPAPPPKPLPKEERSEIIIAHRIWEARPFGRYCALESVSQRTLWPAGEPLRAHRLDNAEGTGIHAFKKRRTPKEYLCNYSVDHEKKSMLIRGTVVLWGRVIEHEHGYRAECAYPDVLVAQTVELAQALRRTYGCEAIVGSWAAFKEQLRAGDVA